MGKYTRKTDRGSYTKDKLREAVREVESGRMSGYAASKSFNIPRMTIMDHVNHKRKTSETLGRNTALSSEIERKLATSLHTMEKYGFGLSRKEVLQMVGDYVNHNKLITSFKNGIPGKDWFISFKKRHHLSVKKPQGVEYARKAAIDPFIVFPYFDLLEKTIMDLNLTDKPSAIWNLDETSFSKDPAKTKVVGAKGHAATRVISSPGRDNTTVLLGANAAGEKAPPLIIFKGKNVWDTWTSPNDYPGTSYAATNNGWMEAEVFEMYFKKTFLPLVKDQRPVLLIYDGHSTHVGLNIIEEARRENITILKLPPHTSHVLQPLDIAVMKSFKDRWDPLLVQWQRLNVGSVLPKSELARLIGQVWSEIDSQVLRNGFRKAGIFPVHREEVKEEKFDMIKLKQWKEYESKRHHLKEQQLVIKNNPSSLMTIVTHFFQKTLKNADFANVAESNNCIIPVQDDAISNDCSKTLESSTAEHNISFEELLLNKLKRSDNAKPKRRKVALGAEVITHEDVIKTKKEEHSKRLKTNARKKKEKISENSGAVIQLGSIPRNDSQVQSFIAKDVTNLPHCLQKVVPDSKKINIISNVVIKEADTDIVKKKEEVKDKKKQKNSKNNKSKKAKKQSNIYKKPKPGPSRLQRRHSSTSVSDSFSLYSDSDIVDTESDTPFLEEDDEINNSTVKIPLISSIDNDKKTNDSEGNQISAYSPGDNVIVRYYMRLKWMYYVGIIEHIKIIDEELCYSIKFYKTIKKPKLTFKMTKTTEHDDIPESQIVKKIDLVRCPRALNNFSMSSEEDEVYF